MDPSTLGLVFEYSRVCKPSPMIRYILVCIAYATKAAIDPKEHIAKGSKNAGPKWNGGFSVETPQSMTANALREIIELCAHEEKLSRSKMIELSGLSNGAISNYRKQLLSMRLIDDDWSIRCDVLRKLISKAKETTQPTGSNNDFDFPGGEC